MAEQVGSENLESKGDEPKIDSYKIRTFPGAQFPQDYKNLILANFLNSLRYGNDLYKLIDKDSYFKAYTLHIQNLMTRPETKIRLALLDDGTALGWCMYENSNVHYVWVKKDVRRQGIGQSLLPKGFDTISHITNKGINIWVNYYPKVSYNPFYA